MDKNKIYIGLVDADLMNGGTRHPNLVLLKLAGFLYDNNIKFKLITDNNENIEAFTKIYISKVFSFTPTPQLFLKSIGTKNESKFSLGGTGDYAIEKSVCRFRSERDKDMTRLENDAFLCRFRNRRGGVKTRGIDMARQMPYYHLYDEYIQNKISEGRKESYFKDYKYFSIGFLTRGCIRHCPFCINKLENSIHAYSELEWFLDNEKDANGRFVRPYIYLWDDNFLAASPNIWRPKLQQLIDSKRPFQFRQGLDERIFAESPYGEEIAEKLSKCKYYGDYIFAFDNWRDRNTIVKALKIWKFYNPKRETKFYLFCGYMMTNNDERLYKDIKELFLRIKVLMQFGCFGYVMRHEDYKNHELSNIYVQIARWCNQPQFYRYMSFWEYSYRNQSYWEQTVLRRSDIPNLKSYEQFLEDRTNGYYDNIRICKPLQTCLDMLDRFDPHRNELLKLFNLRLKDLINPTLWERK